MNVADPPPDDAERLRLLAGAADMPDEAERLLRQAIARAPGFLRAYADLASLLFRLERADEAVALLDALIAHYPGAVWPLSLKAGVLTAERRADEALDAHAAVAACAPQASIPWMNYGYALKTLGRTEEAVAAYRKALDRDPGNGGAWWGLANLRTIRLDAGDVALMEQALEKEGGDPLGRVQLHFALGKAWGDVGDYACSFRHYEEANRLRGALVPYDAEATTDWVRRSESAFTPALFARHSGHGHGHDAEGIIFLIGMPRSGSTLVEQILASHPMVEGGGELFTLREITGNIPAPEAVSRLDADDLRRLGEQYIAALRRHRRTDRRFFTDKMPANWQLVPLIPLILPKAKIVDVRRHPLACCLSAFATYFNRQTGFPADLADLARYYRDYVRMMAHMDAALPGHVLRVHYEQAVENIGTEVPRLLDLLGLPFDPACLRFHENRRAVHTPSAQQVRRPINREGLDHWRHYARWLAPLQAELGSIPASSSLSATEYPDFGHDADASSS